MDLDFFSFKELDDVYLKATYPLEINGTSYEENETIAQFDKIAIACINEDQRIVIARGGFDNRAHVYWQSSRELQLQFSQGVFSTAQFSLLTGAKTIQIAENVPVLVTTSEELESDAVGRIFPTHVPYSNLFVYNLSTGVKLTYSNHSTYIAIEDRYTDVLVIYEYEYLTGASVARLGQRFLNGFLSLEGKTRVKDDTTGQIKTGILKIPKLKLTSDLSIRLGTQANPVVANFTAVGVPDGSRGDSRLAEFYFLESDID